VEEPKGAFGGEKKKNSVVSYEPQAPEGEPPHTSSRFSIEKLRGSWGGGMNKERVVWVKGPLGTTFSAGPAIKRWSSKEGVPRKRKKNPWAPKATQLLVATFNHNKEKKRRRTWYRGADESLPLGGALRSVKKEIERNPCGGGEGEEN